MRFGVAAILALAGGLAWAACFGRQALGVAPWLAAAPLVVLLGLPRAALLGWLHGLGFWLGSVYWIRYTMQVYGQLPAWLSAAILLLLAAYLALYHAAFAGLGARLWRRGGSVALFGLPALWVALEWLRTFVISGFPWNLAAYSWVAVPGALPLTAWIGSYGVSYLVLLAATGLAVALAGGRWRTGVLVVLLCQVALAAGARWAVRGEPAFGRGREVRLVQPDTPNLSVWDEEAIRRGYRRTLELTRQACDLPGSLVVWPESAGWPFSYQHDAGLRRDVEGLVAAGCPLFFNSTFRTPEGAVNAALLLDAGGLAGRYDKRHLVPYGEYVPLAELLPFVGKLARNAGDFRPGSEAAVIPWQDEGLGTAICFESIFPAEVAESVRAGATILVTITNDAWFGDSVAPWQHFTAARFRAAETRRPVLRAAITGVSGLIEPDGSVAARLDPGERGVLRARLSGRRDLSPFVRHPHLVPLLAVLAAASAILLSRRRGADDA